ncbi:MAG: fibronectin type III domain-containing protein [Peptostreptococcaceae bacterium]|nr:fibronectin type III domain-containing protein [Peptostreptococcaceae bacterium]
MAQKLINLPVGAKVKDNLSKYNGQPVVFKIADKNHTGYPSNSITLITDKIISFKAYGEKESGNGNNNYKYSILLQWLNSSGGSNWYSSKHGADAPPNTNNATYNPYDNEPGFLYNFSADLRNAMLNTTVKVARHSSDGGGSEQVSSKIFLASTTEVGLANEAGIQEGSKLALFDGNESRKAYPTPEAVSKSNYKTDSLNQNSSWYWWLRTPYKPTDSDNVCFVNPDGTLGWNSAYYGHFGVRPLCNLSSEILVSNNTDTDGAYTIIWNQPPTTPTGITVPTKVQAGKTLEITWGTSTDPEGNSVGYILERQVDSKGYTQLYKGISRSFKDTITRGWQTVIYRVKAYDNYGNESNYRTSSQRTVNNNADPVINTEQAEDLGTKTGSFNMRYSVTDTDEGQTLTVTEYINNAEKRNYKATSGSSYSFNVTKEEWQALLNGSNTLKIKAEDSEGGITEKVFTLKKNETEILLELKAPLEADAMVTKALLTMIATIPQEAITKIEICNNGNDEKPTWEDVTQKVQKNSKIFLTNKSKTAEKWGVNIRVSIKRNGASGDCYISSIGGNFE